MSCRRLIFPSSKSLSSLAIKTSIVVLLWLFRTPGGAGRTPSIPGPEKVSKVASTSAEVNTEKQTTFSSLPCGRIRVIRQQCHDSGEGDKLVGPKHALRDLSHDDLSQVHGFGDVKVAS